MNMVQFAAGTIKQVDETDDLIATDLELIKQENEMLMMDLLQEIEPKKAVELEKVYAELRGAAETIAYRQGFAKGIQFIVTAMNDVKSY